MFGPRYEIACRLPVPAILTPAFNVLRRVVPSHLLAMYWSIEMRSAKPDGLLLPPFMLPDIAWPQVSEATAPFWCADPGPASAEFALTPLRTLNLARKGISGSRMPPAGVGYLSPGLLGQNLSRMVPFGYHSTAMRGVAGAANA